MCCYKVKLSVILFSVMSFYILNSACIFFLSIDAHKTAFDGEFLVSLFQSVLTVTNSRLLIYCAGCMYNRRS